MHTDTHTDTQKKNSVFSSQELYAVKLCNLTCLLKITVWVVDLIIESKLSDKWVRYLFVFI